MDPNVYCRTSIAESTIWCARSGCRCASLLKSQQYPLTHLTPRLQAFQGAPQLPSKGPLGLKQLPSRSVAAAATDDGKGALHPEKMYLGSPVKTWRKIIPLLLMFFCILFNYTILRDTKVRATVALREQVQGWANSVKVDCLILHMNIRSLVRLQSTTHRGAS